jgi:hypothetical protein
MDRIEFFMTFIAIGVTLIDRVALHLHGLKHSQFPVKAQAATAGCFNWQSVTGSYYYRPKVYYLCLAPNPLDISPGSQPGKI